MIAVLVLCAVAIAAVVCSLFRDARRAALRADRALAVVCASCAWVVIVGPVPLVLFAFTPNPDVGWFGVTLSVLIAYLHVRRISRAATATRAAR